jgi:hypothetical protein
MRSIVPAWRFPVEHWANLNQTWARLGQLLNEPKSCMAMVWYMEEQVLAMENLIGDLPI